ncbi:MAG TPA: FAD binding domain-containing protein [Chloroflexota bacterium]|jgi:xanthine dehydrogenase YagS FAD-binding subunit
MKEFELYEPQSVAEATQVLVQLGPKAKVLGGGSDLVGGIMKDWITGKGMPIPDALIDLTTVPGLNKITVGANGATVGATATLTEIAQSKELQQQYPLLTQAVLSVASPLIRNFGTLGGNVNQRPRCWFFRGEGFNCYKKGGDFCFAVTGDNRYHAIIGGELCYIVHPSDTATALLALNASARVVGGGGERTIPFDSYFIGPREDVLRETVLKADDIMLDVSIPTPAAGTKMGWTKIKDRQVYDFAMASVAVAFTVENGTWKDGRVALGGVAPVPYRAKVIEDALKGKDIKANVKAAAAQIRTVARPMSLNAYKIDLVQGILERTILQALG